MVPVAMPLPVAASAVIYQGKDDWILRTVVAFEEPPLFEAAIELAQQSRMAAVVRS